MVYRLQEGLGAAAVRPAKSVQVDKIAQRKAVADARDEWKRYIASLRNMILGLRRGALPPDQGLPSAPSSPPEMVPDLLNQAKNIIERDIPTARSIAQSLQTAAQNRVATSGYAAGQPAVSPEGNLTNTDIPQGDLPGQTQQVITDAYGVTPVLAEGPASQFREPGTDPYAGQVVDSGQVITYQPSGAGGASAPAQVAGFPLKKILVVAGLGLAVWLAYKWWSKRKR